MMDREKVVKKLQELLDQSRFNDSVGWNPDCDTETLEDALALLKAQEPRVMALEEVKSAWRNRDIAFLVEYNDGGNPVWMLYYGYLSTLEEIVLIDEIAHLRHFGVDGYGVDWRCWTSRPDEKRRSETPWES